MEKLITVIILLCIIAALVVYLISRSKSVETVTRAAKDREDDAQAKEDEKERRRMLHEADSKPCADLEPFCGGNDAHAYAIEQLRLAKAEADRQARSRQAIRRAQEAAHASKSSSAAEHEVFIPVMMTWGSSGLPASSDSSASSSKFSGSGGSFDGGGSSGDWGGSSSSSSSSSDCSSSSSDSGGSCGGSSD